MSKIEWTEATWNPIAGCTVLSPGCTNCYAMRMAARIEAMGSAPHYAGTTKKVKGKAVWTGKLVQAPEETLLEPLRRKRPTTYFVNSMSDLFHENVPDEWIDRVWAVMALAPRHNFQVLTKRAARMRAYFAGMEERCFQGDIWTTAWVRYAGVRKALIEVERAAKQDLLGRIKQLPLPNVWLGVSAERQQEANERVLDLIDTPAAVRFVSAEPLLGPIDFTRIPGIMGDTKKPYDIDVLKYPEARVDWVIVGGESGPGARPFKLEWAWSIVKQCREAGIACFVKQLGADPRDSVDRPIDLDNRKGGDPSEWPVELRVREMPVIGAPREVAA